MNKLILSFTALTLALVAFAQYQIFMVVPDEQVMGAVQRIFYFHVASAVSCYAAFAIVFFCSLGFLVTRNPKFDVINAAAGEVGFIFCTITLGSGMIWGHSAWNTWFRWEPRLVTFLLLWQIFLGFNLLRHFGNQGKLAAHTAVVGMLGALTVPLVWISIKFVPQFEQLHPQVIENRRLKDSRYIQAMVVSMVALFCLQLLLVFIRSRLGFLKLREEEAS